MSRSYKHFPFAKDRQSCKWGKRYCNKKVRKTKDIPNGKAYKKILEPWDFIYDYSCTEFEEWVIKSYNAHQKDKANGVKNWVHSWGDYDDLEDALNNWKKYYIRK